MSDYQAIGNRVRIARNADGILAVQELHNSVWQTVATFDMYSRAGALEDAFSHARQLQQRHDEEAFSNMRPSMRLLAGGGFDVFKRKA